MLASIDRPVEMGDRKELVVRRDPGIEVLPDELILDDLGNGVGGQLVEPRHDFLAGPADKGGGAASGQEGRDAGERRATLDDEFPALNFAAFGRRCTKPSLEHGL